MPLERAPAREHFVQHAPEREDVGATIHLLPLQLLGRHVLQRSGNRAFLRSGMAVASSGPTCLAG
jgi:hypothetical protein